MYNRIGASYNATRRADPYIVGELGRHLSLEGGRNYLDLACGTGNYSIALASQAGNWVGVDIAGRMIEQARQQTSGVHWSLGAGEDIPFKDGTFSGAICVLALHHFEEHGPIFREVHRVLGKGVFAIFTADPDQMRGYWLNEYFPEAMRKSIEQMPTLERVCEALEEAGFRTIHTQPYGVRDDLQDLFLYSGKHRPHLYMDEAFRAGISTFFSLADPREVEVGCAHLALDIESGRISEVMEKHDNTIGDYMFIIGSASP